MDELKQQTIEFYSKLLKLPTFKYCNDIIQHLDEGAGNADFLIELMKNEYDTRQAATRQRHIKAAHFPYLKTFDELDLHRFEHLDEAYLNELATCDFIKKRKNIVMIGNPGTGKTHLSIALGIKACNLGMKVKFYTAANLANSLIEGKRSIAGIYPSYPNFFIITSTSWKIRAKNPNIREVDYGDTTCYSGKAACDLDRDYSGMQEQRHENKGLAC